MQSWKKEEPISSSLKQLIKKLGTATVIEDETWKVVRCQSATPDGSNRYYAMRKTDLLGQGANGKVYKAYQVNTEGNILLNNRDKTDQLFAIKVINKGSFDAKEAEIQSRYSSMERPVFDNNEVMIVGEYFSGKEVTNVYFQTNTELESLSISQLFDITLQMRLVKNICGLIPVWVASQAYDIGRF